MNTAKLDALAEISALVANLDARTTAVGEWRIADTQWWNARLRAGREEVLQVKRALIHGDVAEALEHARALERVLADLEDVRAKLGDRTP